MKRDLQIGAEWMHFFYASILATTTAPQCLPFLNHSSDLGVFTFQRFWHLNQRISRHSVCIESCFFFTSPCPYFSITNQLPSNILRSNLIPLVMEPLRPSLPVLSSQIDLSTINAADIIPATRKAGHSELTATIIGSTCNGNVASATVFVQSF